MKSGSVRAVRWPRATAFNTSATTLQISYCLQGGGKSLGKDNGKLALGRFYYFDYGGGTVNGRCYLFLHQVQRLAPLFEPFIERIGLDHQS